MFAGDRAQAFVPVRVVVLLLSCAATLLAAGCDQYGFYDVLDSASKQGVTTGPLSISPFRSTIDAGQQLQLSASGGEPPYSFFVVSDNSTGTVDRETGLYTAPETATVARIAVLDSEDARAEATVEVRAP